MKTLLFIIIGEFLFPIQKCQVFMPTIFNNHNLEIEVVNIKSFDIHLLDNWGREVKEIVGLEEGIYTYQIDYLCQDGTHKTKEGDIKLIKDYRH